MEREHGITLQIPIPLGPGNSPSYYEHNPWLLSWKTINGKMKWKEIPSSSPLTKFIV